MNITIDLSIKKVIYQRYVSFYRGACDVCIRNHIYNAVGVYIYGGADGIQKSNPSSLLLGSRVPASYLHAQVGDIVFCIISIMMMIITYLDRYISNRLDLYVYIYIYICICIHIYIYIYACA